jgi:hypothetical protein
MGKGRLEAFSDGVITIMVLKLKVPHGATFDDLLPVLPILGSYVLSFIYVGIYWNKLQYGGYPQCQSAFHHYSRKVGVDDFGRIKMFR